MPCIEYYNPMRNYLILKALTPEELNEYFMDVFASWGELTIRNFTSYNKFNESVKKLR